MSFETVLLLFPLLPLQRMRNCSDNSNCSSAPPPETRFTELGVATVATVAVALPKTRFSALVPPLQQLARLRRHGTEAGMFSVAGLAGRSTEGHPHDILSTCRD